MRPRLTPRHAGWLALIGLSLGAMSCESEPPDSVVCVTVTAEAPALRAAAMYFDRGRLYEVIDDVPVQGGQACLALTPPADPTVRPESDWELGVFEGDRFRELVWPIELAAYTDLNGNARLDPGELIGRSSSAFAPTWLPDSEALLVSALYTESYRGSVLQNTLRPFVWTTLDPLESWSVRDSGIEPPPTEVRLDAEIEACQRLAYPRCQGYTEYDAVKIQMVDPSLEGAAELEASYRAEGRPVWPFSAIRKAGLCERLGDDLLVVIWTFHEPLQLEDECTCRRLSTRFEALINANAIPDWVQCQ